MPQNIGDNVISQSGIARIQESDALRLAKYRLRDGDIVYSRRGDVEKRALVRRENDGWLCGTGCLRVRLGDQSPHDPAFLSYLLGTEDSREWIVRHAVGATMPNLNTSILSAVPLTVPEPRVQRAIAEVLGALDDKIAANTKLVQTSAALTQAMFSSAVATSSEESVLSEITELLSRGITPKYSDDNDATVILNQKCVRGQRVDLDPARRTLSVKVREDKLLKLDDVLVNSTGQGTLGRVARWTHHENVTVDSHITIVRFDRNKVDPVCAGVGLLGLQQTIIEMGEGSTGQTELSRVELGKLRIRLPDFETQRALGRRFASMANMERINLEENRRLAATRDALLPQLMSGKLRVREGETLVAAAV
ncbi:restriction endonuclease subunit S [Pseudarthrobacter sp. So.54]